MEKEKTAKSRSEYIPGTCNIGQAEIRLRLMSGWLGLGLTIVLWIILELVHSAPGWKLFVFMPAMLSASGFLQAYFHFCAGFGMKGMFNFGLETGKTIMVMQDEFRKKDRQKSLFIMLLSALIGGIIAVAAFLIRF